MELIKVKYTFTYHNEGVEKFLNNRGHGKDGWCLNRLQNLTEDFKDDKNMMTICLKVTS